jgi:putative PEP-CTERM system histidine kinase
VAGGGALTGLAFWGGVIAACAFISLAVWQLSRNKLRRLPDRAMVGALILTALWCMATALAAPDTAMTALTETLRNAGWLYFLYAIMRRTGGGPVTMGALMGVLLYVLIGTLAAAYFSGGNDMLLIASLRMLFAVGALVLVHNIYHLSQARSQGSMALALTTLAAIWTYDLGLYLLAILPDVSTEMLWDSRALIIALLVPAMGIALLDSARWRFALSHQAAFQFTAFGVLALYVGAVVLLGSMAHRGAAPLALGFVALSSVAAFLVIPSHRLRARLKRFVAQHFFKHRYDYRTEWMRFADTVGLPDGGQDNHGRGELDIGARIVRAIANIVDAPEAALLQRGAGDRFRPTAEWNWGDIGSLSLPSDLLRQLEEAQSILDGDAFRTEAAGQDFQSAHGAFPLSRMFAAVPLVHGGRLIAIVLLGHPAVARPLDWEDIDILRAAGRQAASYLAAGESQQRLTEARQFDEFNRRFAFALHDIKNVASQLALLARNAERHAGNAHFRKDMIATLQGATAKMQALLARLDGRELAEPGPPRPVLLRDVVTKLVAAVGLDDRLKLTDLPSDLAVAADPETLHTILSHLLQNAVEASAADAPIRLRAMAQGGRAVIALEDEGCGMDAEFVRSALFRPFQSTKPNGLGIGVYEARILARAMGGDVRADSTAGSGSVFTIELPLAAQLTDAAFRDRPDAERAAA